MKILIINTVPTGRNGITNVIFNLHRALDKSDIVIDYVSINEPDEVYCATIKSSGGEVYVLPRRMKKILTYIIQLRAVVRKNRYDAVHVHGNSAMLVLDLLAIALGGSKVRIAHSHNTTCTHPALHRLLIPTFRLLCTHRLACGQDAGRWLYSNQPFLVLNNGVDTKRFSFQQEARQRMRKALGISDSQKIVGHVGLFNEAKNQCYLVDMMKTMSREYKLLFIGGGALRESVEQKVRELGLSDRVIFGGVTDCVEDYLSAFDLLVMPSLYEGLPLSLIEAQASGLKCLVSDNITREVDKTGNLTFLSLEEGAEKWAQTVQEMKLAADRDEASKIAIERIVESGYDIQTEAEKLKYYYRMACGDCGKGSYK